MKCLERASEKLCFIIFRKCLHEEEDVAVAVEAVAPLAPRLLPPRRSPKSGMMPSVVRRRVRSLHLSSPVLSRMGWARPQANSASKSARCFIISPVGVPLMARCWNHLALRRRRIRSASSATVTHQPSSSNELSTALQVWMQIDINTSICVAFLPSFLRPLTCHPHITHILSYAFQRGMTTIPRTSPSRRLVFR